MPENPLSKRERFATPAKSTWGGSRPGAGRPPSPTIRLRVTIQRETAAILERMAKAKGLCRRIGAPPFLGAAVDDLAQLAKTAKPPYLILVEDLKAAQ